MLDYLNWSLIKIAILVVVYKGWFFWLMLSAYNAYWVISKRKERSSFSLVMRSLWTLISLQLGILGAFMHLPIR